ncbi:hypothetical protein HMPREF0724_10238 [Prescottella equi ATCC 33707]|uniref:Uncharacterized protein n=1 Tax=Prescottella equi ATCC 33707 TaxID=525370 RepID=E9SVH0_RHOHA|nr:hypothetical protein HMPREF0724_10238 [Prescottella equi ATCC 33707]
MEGSIPNPAADTSTRSAPLPVRVCRLIGSGTAARSVGETSGGETYLPEGN